MSRRILALAVLALTTTALAPSLAANAGPSPTGALHGGKVDCAQAPVGHPHCRAHVDTRVGNVTPDATMSYQSGYNPAQLLKVHWPTGPTGPTGTTTIAIVDATRTRPRPRPRTLSTVTGWAGYGDPEPVQPG